MYEEGEGVEKNPQEGVGMAPAGRNSRVCGRPIEPASKHEYGQGVAQDYAEALRENGASWPQTKEIRWANSTGGGYRAHTGRRQDYPEALIWYRLAADQGNPVAEAKRPG